MLRQIEGSRAVAEAVAACRPGVVCAYPITPQTHIVEAIGAMTKSGQLTGCRFVNVESEFAAISVAMGASAVGTRAYTATASQGLLFMLEAVYNAGGLGLPIVMTVANRAIGAPINIWNDHSDAMAARDAGWIQLFAENNQEATDLHIQAFRLAEEVSLPVMVCMDGFVLTHAVERVDVPSQDEVDAFLPPFTPRQVLDPRLPTSIGALVGPEAFEEVRYLAHVRHLHALNTIERIGAEYAGVMHRPFCGLVSPYRSEDAELVVVALGSVLGTVKDVVDELRSGGAKVGVVGITAFRPFPLEALHRAVGNASQVVVIDRALSAGLGGILSSDVAMALDRSRTSIATVIAGLGGRAITEHSIESVLRDALVGRLEPLRFLDLDHAKVQQELAHLENEGCSLPTPDTRLGATGLTKLVGRVGT